jgi:hypothetical protein
MATTDTLALLAIILVTVWLMAPREPMSLMAKARGIKQKPPPGPVNYNNSSFRVTKFRWR